MAGSPAARTASARVNAAAAGQDKHHKLQRNSIDIDTNSHAYRVGLIESLVAALHNKGLWEMQGRIAADLPINATQKAAPGRVRVRVTSIRCWNTPAMWVLYPHFRSPLRRELAVEDDCSAGLGRQAAQHGRARRPAGGPAGGPASGRTAGARHTLAAANAKVTNSSERLGGYNACWREGQLGARRAGSHRDVRADGDVSKNR